AWMPAPDFAAATPAGEPLRKPHVLLIMTDDQGYGDFSLHGNPYLQTPHLDALAQSGVQFERFYVNSFCSPTRAALLTGRYPLRCGVWGVTHSKETMRQDEVTLVLGSGGDQPRFCYVAYNAPHSPFQVPDRYFDRFHAKGLADDVSASYGMCENLDDNVGRLLAASGSASSCGTGWHSNLSAGFRGFFSWFVAPINGKKRIIGPTMDSLRVGVRSNSKERPAHAAPIGFSVSHTGAFRCVLQGWLEFSCC
nr:sulfatase-like hydrolase/transferase [Pirellulaceae bacterium]